jgi:hypothetical protein
MPGRPGTAKYLRQYGASLECVRYKYNAESGKRKVTVELAVSEKDWKKNVKRIPPNRIMKLKVEFGEIQIGRLVRSAGGRWNSEEKVWEIPYREVVVLGLEKRIVKNV